MLEAGLAGGNASDVIPTYYGQAMIEQTWRVDTIGEGAIAWV